MITLEAFSRLANEAIQSGDSDLQRVLELIAEAAAGGAGFIQIDAQAVQLGQPESAAEHLRYAGLIAEYSERASGRNVLHVQWQNK
jgi:hypothetical protein